MADKIKKFLAKLSRAELNSIQALLLDIENREFGHLDIKALKGNKDVYRVRKGRLRVIFSAKDDQIRVISIGRRDDKTYKDF